MRIERVPGGNTLGETDVIYDGPNNPADLYGLRQKATNFVEDPGLTEEEHKEVDVFVAEHRYRLSPNDYPEVVLPGTIIPGTRCRVLVREETILEIYGHGEYMQAQIIYPRLEWQVGQVSPTYPDARAAMTFSANR